MGVSYERGTVDYDPAHDLDRVIKRSGFEVQREREFFIDNLLVRIHLIIEMIRWSGLAPWDLDRVIKRSGFEVCSASSLLLSSLELSGTKVYEPYTMSLPFHPTRARLCLKLTGVHGS